MQPGILVSGLAFEYFKGHWTKLPDYSALTPVRNGVADALDLACTQGEKSDFGLRFSGYIEIPQTDVYVLYVNSDDGTRLRIDGQDFVVNDVVHGMTEVKGEIALEAGWHSIELFYFQGTGGQGLQVGYEGPGFLPRPIPKEALRHKGGANHMR